MTRAYWFEHKEQGGFLATDNRNYQPGVLRLNISPIGSVIPEKPRVFNRIQEPRAPSWLPPLPRRNFAL